MPGCCLRFSHSQLVPALCAPIPKKLTAHFLIANLSSIPKPGFKESVFVTHLEKGGVPSFLQKMVLISKLAGKQEKVNGNFCVN